MTTATPNRETVGISLRAMRQGVGLPLVECARRAGVTKSTLSRVERGERVASLELLARLARVIADEANSQRRIAS